MPNPKFRTMWMFPRNIRKIEAWKLVQISQLLEACTGNTTSQTVQDQLYDQLENLGLKCKANAHGVKNPGGMRTYFAQLSCLGLFWQDHDRGYSSTFAGEELINARSPLRILRCQLLRMQYPSVYGLGRNVSVDPSMKVKPFVFLIELWQDPRLGGYLTCLDIAVAVVYGRTHKCHDICVEKILKVRETGDLATVIESVDDVRTPKRYHEHNPEEDLARGIQDAKDIANTAKNYLESAQLIVTDAEDNKRFELNEDVCVQGDICTWMDERIEPLDPDHLAAWQQRFGRYTKTKSIRSRSTQQINGEKALVCSNFINAVTEAPYAFNLQAFINDQAATYGKTPAEIGLLISGVRDRVANIERDTIKQAAASGGREAISLEKAVTGIFRKLGFDLSEHIGQKTASNREGGYPDIRIRASGMTECGFGDSKATMNYGLPLNDTIKLKTYYKDCWQEFDDKTPSKFFLYIAGGFGKSAKAVESSLQKCSESYGQPVSAVTVDALLDLVEMTNPPPAAKLMNVFKKGGYFASCVDVENAV